MTDQEHRSDCRDRRRFPRGGRRDYDLPGRFPYVLVADSYEGARIPCVKYLDRFGFRVEEAVDGSDALAKIESRRSHLVLVESGLPNAPLSRIVQRMRGGQVERPVPLIVMTSDLDADTEGVDSVSLISVLPKPFSLSTMLDEIRRLLREQPPFPAEVSACGAGV
jgi:DNA-binding response OmpR family regulator